MDFCSIACVFLGYNPSHHGYRCVDPTTNCLYIARHVRFNEQCFPFKSSSSTSPTPPSSPPDPYFSSYPSDFISPNFDSSIGPPLSSPTTVTTTTPTSSYPNQPPVPLQTYSRRPKSAPINPQPDSCFSFLHRTKYPTTNYSTTGTTYFSSTAYSSYPAA